MIFDSHCHLNDKALMDDLDNIIQRAKDNGVDKFLVIGWNLESSINAVEISKRYEGVYAAIGIHPTDVKEDADEVIKKLEILAKNPKVKAIGEIGLDYYWVKEPELRERQKIYFVKLIELANEVNLPIVIHNRDSIEDCLEIIKNHKPLKGGVVHCFSGSVEVEREFVKLGLHISLGGPVTFKNARVPKEVAADVPLTSLLVETDCPYLTPHPFRGTTNEPKYTKLVVEEIARLRNIEPSEVAEVTYQNTLKLFNI